MSVTLSQFLDGDRFLAMNAIQLVVWTKDIVNGVHEDAAYSSETKGVALGDANKIINKYVDSGQHRFAVGNVRIWLERERNCRRGYHL
jgi:hypothetical protein